MRSASFPICPAPKKVAIRARAAPAPFWWTASASSPVSPSPCNTRGAKLPPSKDLAHDGELHPLQAAFKEHDGFQCGYCTPGQICSAIGMFNEFQQGLPSAVTPDVSGASEFSDEEIRERMSGNLCRCGAYNGILEAVRETFAPEVTG